MSMPVETQTVPFLLLVGQRMEFLGRDAIPFVRREKAAIFSGWNSHPAQVAPAGSNRSGSGGNDTAEAFDGKGRFGDSASSQAVT